MKIIEESLGNTESFVDDIDGPEIFEDSLGELEELTTVSLYPKTRDIPEHKFEKNSRRQNVSFSMPEQERKRFAICRMKTYINFNVKYIFAVGTRSNVYQTKVICLSVEKLFVQYTSRVK